MDLKNLRARFKKFLNSFEKGSNVYILPSRFGLFYLTVTFISFVFSLSFGHPLSYFFSIVLLVFFVMIAFLTNGYMKGVDVKRMENLYLTDDNTYLNLSFFHSSSVPAYFQIEILDHEYLVKRYDSKVHLRLTNWGSVKDVNLKVSSVYPFFLFRSWKNIKLIQNLYILPGFKEESLGEIVDDDLEIREYIDGDKFSSINWKRSSDDRMLVASPVEQGNSNLVGRSAIFDLIEKELPKEQAYSYLGQLYFYIQNKWQVRSLEGRLYTQEYLKTNLLKHMEKYSYGG